MLSGWRIASPKYAKSIDQMMSGEGAYIAGGRWNSPGTRVVYLGTSIAQASLELLVNLQSHEVLKQYRLLEVKFDESFVQHIPLEDLPTDWREPTMASSVQSVGDNWVKACSSLILQVPSAAVQGEHNYLLNPAHPGKKDVQFGAIRPFEYDTRTLKA